VCAGAPPTDRLNLVLPELNTVIDAQILARADPKEPWQVRVLRPTALAYSSAPPLEVQWRAYEVIFLARREGPYTMVYGNSSAMGAAAPLASLPNSLAPVPATLGPRDPWRRVTADIIFRRFRLAEQYSLGHADRGARRTWMDGLQADEGTKADAVKPTMVSGQHTS
jgi:hypothetical protein